MNTTGKGQFKKGNPGGGRPKLPEEIRDAARAASPKAIETLIKIMDNDDCNDGERIKAAVAILNRAYGTPAQSVEISGKEGGPIGFKFVDPPSPSTSE